MAHETNPFEVGDKLHYIGPILIAAALGVEEDYPMDDVARDVTVVAVDSDGMVYIEYGDGVDDYMPWQNLDEDDYYERVTWDTTTS